MRGDSIDGALDSCEEFNARKHFIEELSSIRKVFDVALVAVCKSFKFDRAELRCVEKSTSVFCSILRIRDKFNLNPDGSSIVYRSLLIDNDVEFVKQLELAGVKYEELNGCPIARVSTMLGSRIGVKFRNDLSYTSFLSTSDRSALLEFYEGTYNDLSDIPYGADPVYSFSLFGIDNFMSYLNKRYILDSECPRQVLNSEEQDYSLRLPDVQSKFSESLIADIQRRGVANVRILSIPRSFRFEGTNLFPRVNSDTESILSSSLCFLIRVKCTQSEVYQLHGKEYVDYYVNPFIPINVFRLKLLVQKGFKLELATSLDDMRGMLQVIVGSTLERNCEYSVRVLAYPESRHTDLEFWKTSGVLPFNPACEKFPRLQLRTHNLSEYMFQSEPYTEHKPTFKCNDDASSSLTIVALKSNSRVVGYRFLEGDKKYDISIECASSLGLSGFKVEKQLTLTSVGGVLLSDGEVKSKKIVKDISEDTELVNSLFRRLLSREG